MAFGAVGGVLFFWYDGVTQDRGPPVGHSLCTKCVIIIKVVLQSTIIKVLYPVIMTIISRDPRTL